MTTNTRGPRPNPTRAIKRARHQDKVATQQAYENGPFADAAPLPTTEEQVSALLSKDELIKMIADLRKDVAQAREDREIQVRRADDLSAKLLELSTITSMREKLTVAQNEYNLLARVNGEQVNRIAELENQLEDMMRKNERLERELGFLKDLEMQLKLRGEAAKRAIRALVELVT